MPLLPRSIGISCISIDWSSARERRIAAHSSAEITRQTVTDTRSTYQVSGTTSRARGPELDK
jgi:hypothetical protein